MNWNKNKSLKLSKLCVLLFVIVLAVGCITAPWLFRRLITLWGAPDHMLAKFLVTTYLTAIPVAVALFYLHSLLKNISQERVFDQDNVKCLRYISWCCFGVALVCGISVIYCTPLLAVAVMAAFVGLVLRVVKNVFAQAVWLKEENDYTV